jgi:hypothetical protein
VAFQLFFIEVLIEYGPVIALLVQALVLSRFLNPRNRDYPLAIVFSLVLFLLTSAGYFFERFREYLPRDGKASVDQTFILVYSAADLFMHVLLLALMLQLIRKTLLSLGLSPRIVVPLAAISFLVAISAYNYFGSADSKKTLLQTRQVVSFWMVLLNLYWWTLLLRKRQLDRRVLLLSAGIGLMMTGQVIGDGIASFSERKGWMALVANLIMYGTHFACLYTWYSAFQPSYATVSETKKLDPSLT